MSLVLSEEGEFIGEVIVELSLSRARRLDLDTALRSGYLFTVQKRDCHDGGYHEQKRIATIVAKF